MSEARLQKALSASDERLRGQIFALVSDRGMVILVVMHIIMMRVK